MSHIHSCDRCGTFINAALSSHCIPQLSLDHRSGPRVVGAYVGRAEPPPPELEDVDPIRAELCDPCAIAADAAVRAFLKAVPA